MNMSNFVATMAIMANRANHANLSAACSVLTLIKENGGTNKKASSALWALLPEATIQTFAQVKRVSGALNASADKATNGAKQVRAIWLESANADDMTDKLLDIGIASPRSLLDYVAPRKDPRAPSVKTAVEIFLAKATEEGFNEDLTPLLVWLTKGASLETMLDFAQRATAEKAGREAEAAEAREHAEYLQALAARNAADKATKAEMAKNLLIEAGLYTEGLLAAV